MVFTLIKEDDNSIHRLLPGKTYTVGRKAADILLETDKSISRHHATITTENDYILVTDCESKYGTFFKGKKHTPKTPLRLEIGDLIQFGVFKSSFLIGKEEIVTTCSGLTTSEKETLKTAINQLGGTFSKTWTPNCTHLTLQKILFTLKVLHAVIDAKPIVTIDFWTAYAASIAQNSSLPDPKAYQPAISEILLTNANMEPNAKRKSLFRNKMFFFSSETSRKQVCEIIDKTGGMNTSWGKKPMKVQQVAQCKNYIFIKPDEKETIPAGLAEIYDYLAKNKQRLIPYQEIASAIIECSIEQHCNPHFDVAELVYLKETANKREIPLAFDTDNFIEPATDSVKQEVIIPPSLDEEFGVSRNLKRNLNSTKTESQQNPFEMALKRNIQSKNENPAKKIKVDANISKEIGKTAEKQLKIEESFAKPEQRTKRKAETSLETTGAKKLAENTVVNPFSAFMSSKINKSDDFFEPNTSNQTKSLFSSLESTTLKATPLNETKWFSRASITSMKLETKNEDVEGEEISYRFPVENIKIIVVKMKEHCNSTLDTTKPTFVSGKKNFKKFVKKQNKKYLDSKLPNMTLIRCGNQTAGNETLKKAGLSSGEDSDVEEKHGLTVSLSNKTTKTVSKPIQKSRMVFDF